MRYKAKILGHEGFIIGILESSSNDGFNDMIKDDFGNIEYIDVTTIEKINTMKLELELHELPLDKDGFVNFEILKCDINDFIILVDIKTNDIQIICEATKCNDFKIKREYATHYASINDFSKREKITFKKGDISKSR